MEQYSDSNLNLHLFAGRILLDDAVVLDDDDGELDVAEVLDGDDHVVEHGEVLPVHAQVALEGGQRAHGLKRIDRCIWGPCTYVT